MCVLHIVPVVCFLVANLPHSHGTTYSVDNSGGYGRRFDGIGGLSGGGATSKLLVNYPEPQKREILDYLFKPNYGASLHILKVEIGGDAQSTDGSESSHMHESWDENYQRGYEWWLMVEAKKRNPDILLYGLPWTFPGWIGRGSQDPYADVNATADYIVRWIMGAQTYYNLKIDIIGIWNERDYNVTYIKTLRRMLDQRGLSHVRISAADDNGWKIVDDILTDHHLADCVDSIGSHYPGTFSVPNAIQSGKQLWASEDYSTYNDNTGAGCWARLINQNYVNGMMTSTIAWNLIASYYQGLPHFREGLMTAVEPWSGHYRVESPIWVTAHTTQFTRPGWKYLKHGSGVGNLTGGGSYVALTDQEGKELTIVIQTMSHDHSICIRPPLPPYNVTTQTASFILSGAFAGLTSLNVWYTKLGFSGSESTIFKRLTPMKVINGVVELSLGVDEMYTLTTVITGQKGTAPDPPPSQPFPLPYKDDFNSYNPESEPFNLAQQKGAWQVVDVGPPRDKVIRQVTLERPVFWCFRGLKLFNYTANVIGSINLTDIYVQVDARVGEVNGTDGLFVAARIDNGGCNISIAFGLFFFIFPSQQKYVLTNDMVQQHVLLAGSVSVRADWNTMALTVKGGRTTGLLNGQPVFNISTPDHPTSGFVGLGTTSPGIADFDNLEIH